MSENRRGRPRRRRDGEEGFDEEFIVGMRRTRRRTSHEYREDSLRPSHIMDMEEYYAMAVEILESSNAVFLFLMSSILFFDDRRRRLCAAMLSSSSVLTEVAEGMLERAKNFIQATAFVLEWLMCLGEMALLCVEDYAFFRRRRRRFQPEKSRSIDALTPNEANDMTGYSKRQLRKLHRHWRIPETFIQPGRGGRYSGEACMIVFLYWIRKGHTYTHMAEYVFGGDPRDFTPMMRLIVGHLFNKFYHKISGDSLAMWIPRFVDEFRYAIWKKLQSGAAEVETRYDGRLHSREYIFDNIPFETFRYFAFADDTGVKTARPGSETVRQNELADDVQRAFYSQYYRAHGLKVQVILLPNGMIGSIFVASLRNNDNGILNMSGLSHYLYELLRYVRLPPMNLLPSVYVDGIFTVLPNISPRYLNPNDDERRRNLRMSGLRQTIEHMFSDHWNLYKLFSMPWLLRLMVAGDFVRMLVTVSFFVLNCHYCLNESRSRIFRAEGGEYLRAPVLEEYLPLEEVLVDAPAPDLGTVCDYQYYTRPGTAPPMEADLDV